MDQQLVIKLTAGDGTGIPVNNPESNPVLYTNFKQLYPTVIFSDKATPSEVEPYWYGVFEWVPPPTENEIPYDKNVEALGILKGSDGIWRPTFNFVNATQEEIQTRTEIKAAEVRYRRDMLLKRTDWIELPRFNISDEDRVIVNDYRQLLRDIPQQSGFPFNVTFPKMPEQAA